MPGSIPRFPCGSRPSIHRPDIIGSGDLRRRIISSEGAWSTCTCNFTTPHFTCAENAPIPLSTLPSLARSESGNDASASTRCNTDSAGSRVIACENDSLAYSSFETVGTAQTMEHHESCYRQSSCTRTTSGAPGFLHRTILDFSHSRSFPRRRS
jgi:hypothetical protein